MLNNGRGKEDPAIQADDPASVKKWQLQLCLLQVIFILQKDKFSECCSLFTLKYSAYLPENIHGGQFKTKNGYRLGVIGLRSYKKPLSPKRGSCKVGHDIDYIATLY